MVELLPLVDVVCDSVRTAFGLASLAAKKIQPVTDTEPVRPPVVELADQRW